MRNIEAEEYGQDVAGMQVFQKMGELHIELAPGSLSREEWRQILGAEPIVRCRSCRYLRGAADPDGTALFCGNLETGCAMIPLSMGADFFCALGELRE